jgi:hypothetical protein
VSAFDKSAAVQARNNFHRGQPANTPRRKSTRGELALTQRPASAASKSADSSARGAVRYPADLSYQGGPVVDFAQSHAIYLLPDGKCPIPQCWGNPEGFLRDLSNSDFIHLVDQYIGLGASRRYTVGTKAKVTYTPPKVPLTDDYMLTAVHAVAVASGKNGYGHIFHVFLPRDRMSVSTPPSNSATPLTTRKPFTSVLVTAALTSPTLVMCCIPSSLTRTVDGCSVSPGTPNGQLVDSTNDVLSHELFETITDPDGDAWLNSTDLSLLGEEIGDECQFVIFTPTNAYFDPFVYEIDEKHYATQPEYSNALHGCSVH